MFLLGRLEPVLNFFKAGGNTDESLEKQSQPAASSRKHSSREKEKEKEKGKDAAAGEVSSFRSDDDSLAIAPYLSPSGRDTVRQERNAVMSQQGSNSGKAPPLHFTRPSGHGHVISHLLRRRPGEHRPHDAEGIPMPPPGSTFVKISLTPDLEETIQVFNSQEDVQKSKKKKKQILSGGPRPRNDLGKPSNIPVIKSNGEYARGSRSVDLSYEDNAGHLQAGKKRKRRSEGDGFEVDDHEAPISLNNDSRQGRSQQKLLPLGSTDTLTSSPVRSTGRQPGQSRSILKPNDDRSKIERTQRKHHQATTAHASELEGRGLQYRSSVRNGTLGSHAEEEYADRRDRDAEGFVSTASPTRVAPDNSDESVDELSGPGYGLQGTKQLKPTPTPTPTRKLAQLHRNIRDRLRSTASYPVRRVIWHEQLFLPQEKDEQLELKFFDPNKLVLYRLTQRLSMHFNTSEFLWSARLFFAKGCEIVCISTEGGSDEVQYTFVKFSSFQVAEAFIQKFRHNFLHVKSVPEEELRSQERLSHKEIKKASRSTSGQGVNPQQSEPEPVVGDDMMEDKPEPRAKVPLNQRLQRRGENEAYRPELTETIVERTLSRNSRPSLFNDRNEHLVSKFVSSASSSRNRRAENLGSNEKVSLAETAHNQRRTSQRGRITGHQTLSPATDENDTELASQTAAKPVPFDLGTPWKSPLTYPREGKNRATIDFQDLERLNEREFLNDNLIDFYIRFLFNQKPEYSDQIYCFNTHFFTALTSGKTNANGLNYEGVKKWTSKINIFEYDFVVIPINENLHWYLAIICNLPQLRKPDSGQDADQDVASHMPQTAARLIQGSEDVPLVVESSIENPTQISELPLESHLEDRIPDEVMLLDEVTTPPLTGQAPNAQHYLDDSLAATKSQRRRTSSLDQKTPFDTRMKTDNQTDSDRQESAAVLQEAHRSTQNGLQHQHDPSDVPANSIYEVPNEPIGTPDVRKQRKKKRLGRTWSPVTPAIITLDSLGGQHHTAVKILKHYVSAEAADKQAMHVEPSDLQGLVGKGIPQQSNWYDCGLYILLYFANFLDNPREFTSKLLQRTVSEQDWPTSDASGMRSTIRETLLRLGKEQEDARKREKGMRKAAAAAAAAAAASVPASSSQAKPDEEGISRSDETKMPAGDVQSTSYDKDGSAAKDQDHRLSDKVEPPTRDQALHGALLCDEAEPQPIETQLAQAAEEQTARQKPGPAFRLDKHDERDAESSKHFDVTPQLPRHADRRENTEEVKESNALHLALSVENDQIGDANQGSMLDDFGRRPSTRGKNKESRMKTYSRKSRSSNPQMNRESNASEIIEIED